MNKLRMKPQGVLCSVRHTGVVAFCAITLWLVAPLQVRAVDGIWITNASSTWGTAANWLGGVIADGVDAIADFSTVDITGARTVTLNTSRTIGTLIFADAAPSHDWALSPSGGSTLTLQVTSGTPTIQVTTGWSL